MESKRNLDNQELTNDSFYEKLTFESASLGKRVIAFVIDILLVTGIWFIISLAFFKEIDAFMTVVGTQENDFNNPETLNKFKDLVTELYLKLIICWIMVKGCYYALTAAIIGNGRTIGKWIMNIGVVDRNTLEEISPTKLFLREFIYRGILETLLIIPYFISIGLCFFRDDSRSLHDILAHSVVIKLDLYEINYLEI